MAPDNSSNEAQLQAILGILQSALGTLGSPKSNSQAGDDGPSKQPALPSHDIYQSQKLVLAAVGKLTELVHDPSSRLLEVSSQYWESRCLFVAAERKIPDILASSPSQSEGVPCGDISHATGIEERKLGRVLRCLCSIGIFSEPAVGCFSNNAVSAKLVDNEPLRAYILLFGLDLYSASDHLPTTLLCKDKGSSYDVNKTAFQNAVNTTKSRWEWLEEKVPSDDLRCKSGGYPGAPWLPSLPKGDTNEPDTSHKERLSNGHTGTNGHTDTQLAQNGLHPRPEHEIFGLAMVGGGKITGAAHVEDFDWGALGEATIVDVGGGAGGFAMQLYEKYEKLKFVIQDREPVLLQAQTTVWPQTLPRALKSGRVSFMPHDFFQPNPVKGANVYWIRYILHDWSDSYCIKILSAVAASMTQESRILIADQVMNTTVGCDQIESAPWPLPANYGYFQRYSHQRDLAMMGIINGIERTPDEFQAILKASGLEMSRIYECRSPVSLVEAVLPRKVTSI